MINLNKNIFRINNFFLYCTIGVIFRIVYGFFLSPFFLNGGEWINLKGDAFDYINYAENLFSHGNYLINNWGVSSHAFRMPGLTPFYLFFRFFTDKEHTLYCLIIFQTILSGIAIYYLSKTTYLLFKSRIAFFITFILFTVSTKIPNLNTLILNESLASSFIIFGAYHFVQFLDSNNRKHLLYCGCFLGWLIFLRPFTILIIPFVAILTLIHSKKRIIDLSLFFIFPFLTLMTWNIRNFNIDGKITFLESSHSTWKNQFPNSFVNVYDIVKGTGGSLIEWNKNSEVNWFFSDQFLFSHFGFKRTPDESLPDLLFTSELTLDLLKEGQKHFGIVLDSSKFLSPKLIDYHDQEAVKIFNRFSENLRKNHFFTYHITSRFRYLIRFLNQNIGSSVRNFKYPFNVVFTFVDAFINFICLTFGFISLIVGLIINRKSIKHWFIYGIAGYCFLIFPIFLKTAELRYIIISFPFLIISAVTVFQHKKLNKKIISILVLTILATSLFSAYNTTINFIIW